MRFYCAGISTHEYFLDYGPPETIQYVRNAQALEELDRLQPLTLAAVDPQMFWSCVLYSKLLVKELLVKELKQLENACDELVQGWTKIYGCYLKTIAAFK